MTYFYPLYLFHSITYYLHLHSFPTRRSSDLTTRGRRRTSSSCPTWLSGELAVARPVGRSEEHTSELQSLTNLVCRLLLEKKKYHVQYAKDEEKSGGDNYSINMT